jgi:hypothetical protein
MAICGLAFAGATVTTLGAGGTASAQTVTVAPQHTATGYSTVNRHKHWRSGTLIYDSWTWESYGCGCGCC